MVKMDILLEPFQFSFMVRALIVSVAVGIVAPVMGSYVVSRGLALMGDALSHAVLPGIAVAVLLGLSPVAGTIPTAIVMAILIGYLSRRTGFSEDTTIGILFVGLFALGLAVLSLAHGLPVRLEDILLGQVLGVSWGDVASTLGLGTLALLLLYAFHKELVFATFDPLGARVAGLNVGLLDNVLLVILALVIVIALQAVGIILVLAMLIVPAATARLLVRRFAPGMAVGALLGTVVAVAGLYISFYLNLPSGPAMTLVAVAFFALAVAARRRVLSR
ncbi:MAG: metal ABC transporter permease [Chloroflexi bacterium]|nr:metal ABC transporter permease [Chloroflexota bacterium]